MRKKWRLARRDNRGEGPSWTGSSRGAFAAEVAVVVGPRVRVLATTPFPAMAVLAAGPGGPWAHSIREPPAFTTPCPRLVDGRIRTAFSLSPPTCSGDVLSPLAPKGDACSGFFIVRFFFLLARQRRRHPALAGPRGTAAARNAERGPNTPDKRCNGNRGSGTLAANYGRRPAAALSVDQVRGRAGAWLVMARERSAGVEKGASAHACGTTTKVASDKTEPCASGSAAAGDTPVHACGRGLTRPCRGSRC